MVAAAGTSLPGLLALIGSLNLQLGRGTWCTYLATCSLAYVLLLEVPGGSVSRIWESRVHGYFWLFPS